MDFRLLRHLTYFRAVAEERHFGRAAQRLGISQPPLSQQIKILESNLGVRLFERSRSGVRLTTEGHQILPAVERLVSEGELLETIVLEARQGRTQRLSIGAIAFTMSEFLPNILHKARTELPGLSIHLTEFHSVEALAALEEGEIDVAFLRAEEGTASLDVASLVRENLLLAVPRGHALAERGLVQLGELTKEPMVFCPRDISPSYFDRTLSICRSQELSPRIAFEARSITSQLAFIACGAAIGLVPESLKESTQSGGVSFVPVDGDTGIVTSAIAWRKDSRNTAVPTFVSLVQDYAASV